jgi:sulfur carrier protein
MEIEINQQRVNVPARATIADALLAYGAKPPYAVAVNGDFVARGLHAQHSLQAGDRLDVVQPVAGG